MSKGIEVMEFCNCICVNIKRISILVLKGAISARSAIIYPYAYPN